MTAIAYRYRLSSIILPFMLLGNGCSVNNVGIGSQSESHLSDYSKIVTYEASGLHFYTVPSFGVQLGYIRQQLIYPVLSNNQYLCFNKVFNDNPPTETPRAKLTYAEIPVMVNTHQTGIGLAMSYKQVRLNLGTSSQKLLSIHKEDSISVYYLDTEKEIEICAVNNLAHNNRTTINE
ncbi:hypothetical protein Q4557_19470 [Shewanella sp. 5_MG-2023]|uniref:hypothetical protein n=1 Tax=Shewanella sp. 5_MG-2023 TaxID=3062656 RepID=UPI0026E3B8AF|nr:hypothetical protein [Shewanella sp. 5_MG-2023]MDO6642130.1 hypothetical protein [Shewanella sp. 5_MG-2023]